MGRLDEARARMVALFAADLDRALQAAQSSRNTDPQSLVAAADAFGAAARRVFYEELTAAATRYEAAPTCAQCAATMLRHDRVRRPVLGLHGELRGTFQRFRCRRCGRGACPGLAGLELRHGCERRLAALALRLCAHDAFELAEGVLAEFGVCLSDNTLMRLVHEVGGERVSARRAQVAAALAGDYAAPTPDRAPQRLYVEVDGFKAQVDHTWREPRALVVFETAATSADERGDPPPRQRVSVAATLADCEQVAAWVTAELARRGAGVADEVILLGDGAAWIWEHVAHALPLWVKRTEILDWYHLCENLAKACAGNTLLLERFKHAAWVGDVHHLLAQLRALAQTVTGERAREVVNVLNYVQRHSGRMNYQNRAADGYIIGSGEIESRCRQLGDRVKASGKSWTEAGLNAVLHLLADDLSDEEVRWAA